MLESNAAATRQPIPSIRDTCGASPHPKYPSSRYAYIASSYVTVLSLRGRKSSKLVGLCGGLRDRLL
jgi:hypothetical protein